MATMFRHTLPAVRHAGEEAPIALAHPQPAAATLVNRDLSLIEFFRRVLEEGMDRSQPILERLKFMAIFSSNIDEFFMIRVSGLKEKLGHRFDVSPDGYT